MSRKKTYLDEFGAMGQVTDILRPYAVEVRERIMLAVGMKLTAEQPKKHVRKGKQSPLRAIDETPEEFAARKASVIQ